jgi:hypothetical protein
MYRYITFIILITLRCAGTVPYADAPRPAIKTIVRLSQECVVSVVSSAGSKGFENNTSTSSAADVQLGNDDSPGVRWNLAVPDKSRNLAFLADFPFFRQPR